MPFRAGLIAILLSSAVPAAAATLPGAPPAKTVPFTEAVQGISVDDPYRWMEAGGPDYEPWMRAQAEAAAAWLKALPRRESLLQQISEKSGAVATIGKIAARGQNLFFARRDVGAQTSKLLVRPTAGGAERVLFDPASLDTEAAKGHSINYWEPSPDGRYVYVGASAGGSEEATLRLIEVATGKLVDGETPQALFNATSDFGPPYLQWLPDSSGFFYHRLQDGVRAAGPGYFANGRSFFHKVGTPFASDRLIAQRGRPGLPEIGENETPDVFTVPGSSWAILNIFDGVDRRHRIFRAPLADVIAGSPKWQPVVQRSDQAEAMAVIGDSLYLLRRDKPRGRVVKVDLRNADLTKAVEVVAERDFPLDNMVPTGDGLYLISRVTDGNDLRLLKPDGSIAQVTLPFPGAIYQVEGAPGQKGLYVSLENYAVPRKRLLVTGTTVTDTGMGIVPPYPTDAYIMETVTYTARDGTKIPLDIVRRKDLPKDGKRPVLLEAYAAYGINTDAVFNPRMYPFLDAGGIYAVAHARGGGEFGRDWYMAGYKTTKPNTWRDVIDGAEWLTKSGWTAPKRITVWGTSAGGIMAGRAVTERPDLWAGMIASVGAMNAMRFEFTPNGKQNIAEFGTVEKADEAKALFAMDSYAHLKDGTAYPPMLVTAGFNDPRVIAWQPAKFAARAMAASTNPVVFKVDFDAGHGIGSMRKQYDENTADVAAFTLWAAEQAK
jgi:prolyl oligopeptidase